MADEVNRAYRVVVTRDDIVDHVRVTVGVGQGHHRYLEAVRLFDQELLTLRVDHEDRPRQPLHLGDTSKVAPEFLVLTIEGKPLPARPLLLGRLLHGLREVLTVLDARLDCLEFGQHPADVTLNDVGLASPYSLLGHVELGLLFRSNEQYLSPSLGHCAHELPGAFEKGDRLVKVDDVDAAALSEYIPLHLGVPPARLVTRSEEHTSELQSPDHLVCRLLLEKKKNNTIPIHHTPKKNKIIYKNT